MLAGKVAVVICLFSCLVSCVAGAPVARYNSLTCEACKLIVDGLQELFLKNFTEDAIVKIIIEYCIVNKIEDKNVCNLVVPEFKDEVLGVFARVALGSSEVCGILLGSKCGKAYDPWNQTWSVPFSTKPKPPLLPIKPPNPTAPKSRILHLSDLHYDSQYTVGLSNDCGEPLCCRPPNPKGNGQTAAGYWGDYKCDVPYQTLENLMQHLASIKDQFDWIYLTGDLPAHNVWNQSRSDQLNVLATCSELFKKYLPDKLVFPSLGNHESAPVNSFPPPFITGYNSLDWLLEGAAKDWSSWLPSDAIDTVLKGGFYSVLIQNNLRVISLQTNFCNNKNWWLLINGTDPAGHLSWLVQELQSAEDKGEKVHIIGHIPPGHGDCIKTWSYNYHKIVNRYESTIIGQFFGHQHSNTIQVYYDETNTSRPMSFAILGPSVTTFTNMNLGYSVYTIDGNYSNSTNALLDFEVFYMNLTDANLSNQPKWILEYTASQDYQMKHGFPEDFDDLVKRFENDDELFQKYYKYVSKMHPPSPYCDSTCKSGYICDIKTTRSGDHSLCDKDINHEQMQLTLQKIKAC